MNKYQINVISGSEDLENIFVRALIKELNRVCKNKKDVLPSKCANLCSKKGGKK